VEVDLWSSSGYGVGQLNLGIERRKEIRLVIVESII
jgi:hypothetical protein